MSKIILVSMNSISNFAIYFFIFSYLIYGILLYLSLFYLVLRFKWNVDYFQFRDAACDQKNWTKFEVESYRYNLYAFFYNVYQHSYLNEKAHDISDKYLSYNYQNIKITYTSTYYTFLIYVCIFMVALAALFIKTGTLLSWLVYVLLFLVFLVYFIVNGLVLDNFKKIDQILQNTGNALFKYHAVYKIMNAIILISDLQDVPVEYSYYKFNEHKQTFQEILESNIATCENLSNTSKIKQVKHNVYANLDFVKYMVLDKLSPFFWKYFDNPYIRIEQEYTKQFDISENVYLSEIFLKRNSHIDYDNISIKFYNIMELIKDNTNSTYMSIYEKIHNDYPSVKDYRVFSAFYQDIYSVFSTNNKLEAFNKVLYDSIAEILSEINVLLKNQQFNSIYTKINKLIHEKLESDKNHVVRVPKDDYIEYFLDNKEVLFDSDSDFQEMYDIVQNQSKYIYAYFAFFVVIFLLVSHYFYKTMNGPNYIYIMIGIISAYLLYGYILTILAGI